MNKLLSTISEISDLYPLVYSFLHHMGIEFVESKNPVESCYENDMWKLLINKKRFEALSLNFRVGEVIHSLLHIVYKHPLIYLEDRYKNKGAFCCASDLIVNQKIPLMYHTPYSYLPQDFDLENNKGLDYYYDNLCDKVIEDTFYHEWNKVNSGLDESCFSFVGDCARSYSATAIGHGSCSKMETIILNDLHINFNEDMFIRRIILFLQDSGVVFDKVGTWTKRSRRFPGLLPGKKNKEAKKGIIYIDTSGSIQEKETILFIKLLNKIIKNTNLSMQIKLFNDAIYKEIPSHMSIRKLEFKKGGTSINSVLLDIGRNPGGLYFILTDGLYSIDKTIKIASNDICWLISKPEGFKHKLQNIGKTVQVFGLIK